MKRHPRDKSSRMPFFDIFDYMPTCVIKPPHHGDFSPDKALKSDKVYAMLASKGRRHFGRPAASLTELDNPKLHGQLPKGWNRSVLDKARIGEETTSAMLLEWMKGKPSVVLFDSIHIKDEETTVDRETGLIENGDTDHVIICGTHVLIIDSKAWRGSFKDRKTGERVPYVYWNDWTGKVVRFGKDFPGGKVHMRNALHLWRQYLHTADGDVDIEGIIHIVKDDAEISRTELGRKQNEHVWKRQRWRLVEKKRFIEALDAWYAGIPDGERFISTDLATLVSTQCCKPYDPRKGLINTALLQPQD